MIHKNVNIFTYLLQVSLMSMTCVNRYHNFYFHNNSTKKICLEFDYLKNGEFTKCSSYKVKPDEVIRIKPFKNGRITKTNFSNLLNAEFWVLKTDNGFRKVFSLNDIAPKRIGSSEDGVIKLDTIRYLKE